MQMQAELSDVLVNVLAAIGGFTAVVSAAAWLAKQLVQQRFARELKKLDAQRERMLKDVEHEYRRELADIQHQHTRDIEQLRALVKDRQDLIATAIAAGTATQLVAQERRVDAIEKLWASFLEIKDLTYWSIISFQINIKYANSDEERTRRSQCYKSIRDKGGWLAVHKEASKITCSIERLRPLLGEQLWLLFWAYDMIVGSAMLNADHTVHSNSGLRASGWHEDIESVKGQLEIVQRVTRAIDPEYLLGLGEDSLRLVLDILEGEIVREIQFLLSGAIATHERLEQAQRLSQLYAHINPISVGPGS